MSDWETIDATTAYGAQQIQLAIVKSLGWKFEDLNDNPAGLTVRGPRWIVTSPQGETGRFFSLTHALAHTLLPDYPLDLSAAWSLFVDLPRACTPRLVRELSPRGDHIAFTYKAQILMGFGKTEYTGYNDSPSVAVCLAWLAYSDELNSSAL